MKTIERQLKRFNRAAKVPRVDTGCHVTFKDVAEQRAVEKLRSPSAKLSKLSERDRSVLECSAVESEAREISFNARPHLSMGTSNFRDEQTEANCRHPRKNRV